MSGETASLLSDYEDRQSVSSDIIGPEDCVICYEFIDMDSQFYATLEHVDRSVQHTNQMYHLTCIKEWIFDKGACPICWEEMSSRNICSNFVEPKAKSNTKCKIVNKKRWYLALVIGFVIMIACALTVDLTSD